MARKPTKVVKVSAKIHEKITGKKGYRTKCYGLGENNKGVIDTLLPIRSGVAGCDWMPNLPISSLSTTMINLAKKGRKFIGFARIHHFDSHTHNRGVGLSQLFKMNPEAICISYNRHNFKVETKGNRSLKYAVVK
jgi:hypothetical protein